MRRNERKRYKKSEKMKDMSLYEASDFGMNTILGNLRILRKLRNFGSN
jgi:hypothetical protein